MVHLDPGGDGDMTPVIDSAMAEFQTTTGAARELWDVPGSEMGARAATTTGRARAAVVGAVQAPAERHRATPASPDLKVHKELGL